MTLVKGVVSDGWTGALVEMVLLTPTQAVEWPRLLPQAVMVVMVVFWAVVIGAEVLVGLLEVDVDVDVEVKLVVATAV